MVRDQGVDIVHAQTWGWRDRRGKGVCGERLNNFNLSFRELVDTSPSFLRSPPRSPVSIYLDSMAALQYTWATEQAKSLPPPTWHLGGREGRREGRMEGDVSGQEKWTLR